MMTDMERRAAAARFAAEWQVRDDEKQETNLFWIVLLQKVGYKILKAHDLLNT